MSNKPEDWGTKKGCAFCGHHCASSGEPKFYDVQGIHYAKPREVPDIQTDFNALPIDQNFTRLMENVYWKNKKWED